MSLQITWIDKPGGSHNPRTRIERVGGNGWQDSATNVISAILGNKEKYYVAHTPESSWVEVAYRDGVPYLRTESDGTPLDNLLSLRNVSER